MTIRRTLSHSIAAGAAGVTTLNAITYLDMAIRTARPPTPCSPIWTSTPSHIWRHRWRPRSRPRQH